MTPKHLLLAGLVGFVASAHAAGPAGKEAIDATWHAPLAPFADPVGDLDPDPAFGVVDGTAHYYLDGGGSAEAWGLRVFARPDDAGWYVLGKHGTGTGTWEAVVVVAGPSGSEQRTVHVATPMFRLDDATLDSANGRFYFVGGAKQSGHADSDFAVTCVDIDNGPDGGVCDGFGNGGTAYIAFDRGGNKDDVARRVISKPNLGVLVAGWAKDDTDRYVFAATALLRASGGLVTRFGANGRFASDLGSIRDNLDVNVYDIALSNAPDQEARLYIAGNFSRDTARRAYDGVVLGLNAWNGVLDDWGPGGHGFSQIWLDLGVADVDTSDAVTAMRVLANGKLALAGWSKDEAALNRLMLARLTSTGLLDINSGFCENAGKCAPFNSGRSFWPAAIGERPDTRGLLVAAENPDNPGVDDETWEMVFLFNRDGVYRQGATYHSPHAKGSLEYTVPAGVLVATGSTMIVGTHRFDSIGNDYDMRLTRLLHADTIFADTFGGANAD
jgi:hypothetical protein